MSKSSCRTSAKEGDESSSTLGRVDVEIMTLPRASLRSRWGWALTLEGPTTKEKITWACRPTGRCVGPQGRVSCSCRDQDQVPWWLQQPVPSFGGSWPGTGQRPGTAREATAPSMANHRHHHHRPWWVGGPRCRVIGAGDGGVETAWNQLLFRLMFLHFFYFHPVSFHRILFRQVPHRAFHWLT